MVSTPTAEPVVFIDGSIDCLLSMGLVYDLMLEELELEEYEGGGTGVVERDNGGLILSGMSFE